MQLSTNYPNYNQLLSKIVPEDKKIVQDMVNSMRPNSEYYEDSWGYILQATRFDGYKWYDPHTDTLIFFGKKSATDSTLVVPLFFAKYDVLGSIIINIQHTLRAPQTILKNINPKDAIKLTPLGFRPYQEEEKWNEESLYDDQTYPQLLINLSSLFTKKGKDYKKLRTALNKKIKCNFRKYYKDDKNQILKILELKDNITNKSKNTINTIYSSSHIIYLEAEVDKFVITNDITGDVLGITATSNVTSKTIALVAAIFRPNIKTESIWGIYHTLISKYHEGYQFANLGGNEYEKTYNFMRRTFHPEKQIRKIHMVYDPK